MPFILDISTAVPPYAVSKENLTEFYCKALQAQGMTDIHKKLRLLAEKTKITERYCCIPDFKNEESVLFEKDDYVPSIEARMAIYKQEILPLAIKAIEPLLSKNELEGKDITHLITVSCTGLTAPGVEFSIAKHFEMEDAEKLAINFMGCYAALKALKHAQYIAKANPHACILIVSVELCSLHFSPSIKDEDIIANLLFADGAAAVLLCGDAYAHVKNKAVLQIDSIGTATIAATLDLMTWDISSTAFHMYLSKELVTTIGDNIHSVVNSFIKQPLQMIDYWAIHPGGVRIVEAVKSKLGLTNENVSHSMEVLSKYGNMSSATILFILSRILLEIRQEPKKESKNIFACAFGPGLTVEMIGLHSVQKSIFKKKKRISSKYGVQV